jgi:molybdopterin molybdotransferase
VSSCCDDLDVGALAVEQARSRILALIQPVTEHEQLGLRQALGRVLSAPLRARTDVPAQTNSAMDGYAVRASDFAAEDQPREYRVIGTATAGHPYDRELGGGECVRIMTGAPLPPQADTVIIQEHAELHDDRIRTAARLQAGQNVRRAGEDIRVGQEVLAVGRPLRPADLGVAASLGVGEVQAFRLPRVAFFSTGDELRSLGEPLRPGDVYDSNRYTLFGMLSRLGVNIRDLGVIPDRPEAIRAAFEDASRSSDVVISSGGVSVGDADYIKPVLEELGDIAFWKIAMKPGRPLTFGRLRGAWFFGLPGNPVAVMVTFYQFVRPALLRLMGRQETGTLTLKARCDGALKKRPGRTEFQRGILSIDDNGEPVVRKTGQQGSGVLTSMSAANCFIVLPSECGGVGQGDWVSVEPFDALV